MQIRCRNCGAPARLPDYHGPLLVKCPVCSWQELFPARRQLPVELDNLAGAAFEAQRRRREAVTRKFESVRQLSLRDFERFCAELFERMGYEVRPADRTADQSHALEMSWEDQTVFVACQNHPARSQVEREEIELLAGSMRHAGVTRGMFVTTGSFADSCAEFEAAGIELMDGNALLRTIESADPEFVERWASLGAERATTQGEPDLPLT